MSRLACMAAVLFLALLALSGCVPDRGPTMRPGEDCLSCHGAGTGAEIGPAWSVAGTVFDGTFAEQEAGLRGAILRLTDSNGRKLSLETNAGGNFYSAEALAFQLQSACLERGSKVYCMLKEVPQGSCNTCHAAQPRWTAPGRLVAP